MRQFTRGFPISGIKTNFSHYMLPEGSTPDAQNVRPFDAIEGRSRGGQRPGLTRYINAQPTGSADTIQCLDSFAVDAAYSGATTLGVRTIKGFAVANGNAYTFTTSFASPTNGASAFSATAPVIFSTRFFDDIHVVDGASARKFYDTSTDTISQVTVSAGTWPVNGANYPRLCGTYFNRLVLSGINGLPHQIFASRVDDETDWDYTQTDSAAAWAGNGGNAFTMPQKIHAICDVSENNVLMVGCDHGIFAFVGDPAFGGKLAVLSEVTGMAWGEPFCIDPESNIYFFGSRGGVFRVTPSFTLERITRGVIDEDLATVDLSSTLVRMAWDDRQQGVCLFLTDLGGGASTNWFYDFRTESWWKDAFATDTHNPVAIHAFDGDSESDRRVLLGAQNGYVYEIDPDATNDDSTAIDAYCYFGPFMGKSAEVVLERCRVILGTGSSNVTVEVYAGNSVEEALDSSTVRFSFTGIAGSIPWVAPKVRGDAIFLKIYNSTASQRWAFERLEAELSVLDSHLVRGVA